MLASHIEHYIQEPIDFKLHRQVAAQVCLPKANTAAPPAGTQCWAAGWGRIKFRGQIADILQEVDVPLISDQVCANTKNERYFQPVGILVTVVYLNACSDSNALCWTS